MLDIHIHNGDFITNPHIKKVSKRYKYYEMLNDSECSEDYDDDKFFEGNNHHDENNQLSQIDKTTYSMIY